MTAATLEMTGIILLNADGDRENPLNPNVTVEKAANLLARDKVEIEDWVEDKFLGPWFYPTVLRLKKYIYLAYEKLNGPPRVSKRNILIRDGRTCAYCGEHATTIDHIHPRSKGGKNTWQNLVAACQKCNHKKGNKTLAEAHERYGMVLQFKGYVPKRSQLRQ